MIFKSQKLSTQSTKLEEMNNKTWCFMFLNLCSDQLSTPLWLETDSIYLTFGKQCTMSHWLLEASKCNGSARKSLNLEILIHQSMSSCTSIKKILLSWLKTTLMSNKTLDSLFLIKMEPYTLISPWKTLISTIPLPQMPDNVFIQTTWTTSNSMTLWSMNKDPCILIKDRLFMTTQMLSAIW